MRQPRSETLTDLLDDMGDEYACRIDLDVSTRQLMGGALVGLGNRIGKATDVAACADMLATSFAETRPMGRLIEVLRAMAEEMGR